MSQFGVLPTNVHTLVTERSQNLFEDFLDGNLPFLVVTDCDHIPNTHTYQFTLLLFCSQ